MCIMERLGDDAIAVWITTWVGSIDGRSHGGWRWRDEDGVGLLIVERSDCDLIICDGASVILA